MTELDKIKESYETGRLEPIKVQLDKFVRKHKDDILRFKRKEEDHWKRPMDLAAAVKLFILNVRTIDMHAEMIDQIKALEEEIRNNTSVCNPDKAGVDWIQSHAPGWRSYRVLSIIYVFERNKTQLLACFAESINPSN